ALPPKADMGGATASGSSMPSPRGHRFDAANTVICSCGPLGPFLDRGHKLEEAIMNSQLRHSLKWQMIVPIPLMVIAAIAAVWFMVPRKVAESAADQAVLAGRSIATQFKTLREYYTENVVDKILSEGTFRASSDHKNDAKAIPLPATMILDLSA